MIGLGAVNDSSLLELPAVIAKDIIFLSLWHTNILKDGRRGKHGRRGKGRLSATGRRCQGMVNESGAFEGQVYANLIAHLFTIMQM